MENPDFKTLLFKSAVCVMACDGEIHEDELTEIKMIARATSYFKGLDYRTELKNIIDNIRMNGKQTIEKYFTQIGDCNFTPVQELLILEVLMRIINADKKIDPNEIKFLKIVKSKLKVHDEIIIERFGTVNLLFDRQYEDVAKSFKDDFVGELKLPKLKDLKGPNIEIIMEKE